MVAFLFLQSDVVHLGRHSISGRGVSYCLGSFYNGKGVDTQSMVGVSTVFPSEFFRSLLPPTEA